MGRSTINLGGQIDWLKSSGIKRLLTTHNNPEQNWVTGNEKIAL